MNNMKILPALLIFAEVSKQQSFTLAAKKMGMSKSAVSQQIKRLEEIIGQQLLSRHTRGMSLTASGEKLLTRCELLQDHVNLALDELSSTKKTPSGTFAITAPHSCERDILIPALNQLCTEFPGIKPKLLITDEVKDLINNKLDVSLHFGDLQDSNYRALPVGSVGEIICTSPVHSQKYGLVKNLDDLKQQRWISTLWQKNRISLYKNAELTKAIPLEIEYFSETNTLPTAVQMVLHDMGVALLPEYAVQKYINDGRIVRLLPSYQGRQWPLFMVHRFQGEKPVHVTRFYQLIKHYFTKVSS